MSQGIFCYGYLKATLFCNVSQMIICELFELLVNIKSKYFILDGFTWLGSSKKLIANRDSRLASNQYFQVM
jgi:hypothetical protein